MTLVVSLLLEDLSSDELILLRNSYYGTPLEKLCYVQNRVNLWKILGLANAPICTEYGCLRPISAQRIAASRSVSIAMVSPPLIEVEGATCNVRPVI